MPGFDVSVSGVSVESWTDEADGHVCRLNYPAGRNASHYVATVGTPVVITAELNGVTAPMDTALGGNPFLGSIIESPQAVAAPTPAAGQSSVQSFTPPADGHYIVQVRRAGGGAWRIPFDAEAAS